jgi:cytochrome c2
VPPTGGDARAGRETIAAYQCGVCHAIPGVRGARGVVGPPLDRFALRSFIGGRVPNTPENLVRWVMDPGALAPGTAMPAVGLDEQQARDVAAYLYGLR